MSTLSIAAPKPAKPAKSAKPANDTTRRTVKIARITFLTAGLAPMPAFSYNSPIADISGSWTRGRIAFESDYATGFNGQPLAGNSWLRYSIIKKAKWTVRSSVGATLVFTVEKREKSGNALQMHRMGTIEGAATRKFSDHISLMVTYQQTKAFDKGAPDGTFISLAMPIQAKGKKISLLLQPQLSYFNFSGNMDGLYASTMAAIQKKKVGIMATLIAPSVGCGWKGSAGITYSF